MKQLVVPEIEQLIQHSGAEKVVVACHDIATGDEILIHASESFHPASIIKLCIMMELFRQAQAGAFSLDDRVAITNDFHSIVDGSSFWLDVHDDSETSLYERIGQAESLRELMRLMIVQSSNLATNILIEKVTPASVTAYMRNLGANDILVLRGVEDNKAYALGLNNAARAHGLMRILECLATRRVVSSQASDEMITILLAQQFNEGIPAQLPPGVRVAHKTGWNEKLYHDAAIVFPPNGEPYVLVVMTQGIAEDAQAHALVASISRVIYDGVTTGNG